MKKILVGLMITSVSLLAKVECLPDFFNFVKFNEKKYNITFSDTRKIYQRDIGTLTIEEKGSDKEKILIVNKASQLKYLKCIMPFVNSMSWTNSSIKLEN